MAIKMTSKIFLELWREAIAADDRDAFASDCALSTIWEQEPEDDDLVPLAEQCGRIWDLAHMSVADIRHAAGLTQMEFAERVCMPLSSLQNWEARDGCASYIRLLLARVLGVAKDIDFGDQN